MALMVAHYDVLARMPLCAELSPCSMGERFLAERLLAGRNQDDLLLYDRGFPSYALFALHQARGVPVCMRLPRRFHPDVDAFIGNGAAEHEITLIPTAKQRKDAQALGIEPEPVTLRLVCVRLKSGEVEVLATSLVSAHESTPVFRTQPAPDFLLPHHHAGERHGTKRCH